MKLGEIDKKDIPSISKRAFWDVDFDNLDWEKNAGFIIKKVIQYGSFDDLLKLLNYYNEKRIVRELLKFDYLPETVYYFALIYFNLDKHKF